MELGRYPLTVFSILVALIVARHTLGLRFEDATEIGKDGIKFSPKASAEITDLASRLNGALAAIEEIKKSLPGAGAETAKVQAVAFEAAQTVSDQTVEVAGLPRRDDEKMATGYIWIGNYEHAWKPTKLATVDTNEPITVAPTEMKAKSEFLVRGNMVVREGLPANDTGYFQSKRSLGSIRIGTKVRLVAPPTPIDREFAVQYWAQIEIP